MVKEHRREKHEPQNRETHKDAMPVCEGEQKAPCHRRNHWGNPVHSHQECKEGT